MHEQRVTKDMGNLYANVRKYRAIKKWTQEQLAEAADSSQQHICDIENGKVKEPGGTLLLRLTYAFNITLNDLFGDP